MRPCILIEWIGLLMSSYTTETKDKPMLAWSLLILFSYCCIYIIFKLEMHEALNTGQVSSVGATCKHDPGRCRVDGCSGCDKSLPDRNASQMITDRCKTQEVKQKDSKASCPFGRHESKYGRMKSLRVTFHDELIMYAVRKILFCPSTFKHSGFQSFLRTDNFCFIPKVRHLHTFSRPTKELSYESAGSHPRAFAVL